MTGKKIIFIIASVFCTNAFAQQKDYPFTAVPFTSIHLSANFWLPRIKVDHMVTIPASFERCSKYYYKTLYCYPLLCMG